LAGAAMPPTIVGDAAIAARREIEHLILERVRAERPAVAENDRLPAAPVFVIDLRAVLSRNRAHRWFLCRMDECVEMKDEPRSCTAPRTGGAAGIRATTGTYCSEDRTQSPRSRGRPSAAASSYRSI